MFKTTILSIAVMLALTACAGLNVDTPESILSREAALMESDVRFGRILYGVENMSWENFPAKIILTPTTLYVTGKNFSMSISYAIIEKASVRDVPLWIWWPLGQPKQIPNMFVIDASEAECWRGCIFGFPDTALGHTAAGIINQQKARLDAFGRLDGPREFWLINGERPPFHQWLPSPKYLASHHPEYINDMDSLLKIFTEPVNRVFQSQLNDKLVQQLGKVTEDENPWKIKPISSNELRDLSEYRERALNLVTRDPTINSSLRVTLTHINISEKISADYKPEVKLSFNISLHFNDLVPNKLGTTLDIEYTARHGVPEWQAEQGKILMEETATAAITTAERVYSLLNK